MAKSLLVQIFKLFWSKVETLMVSLHLERFSLLLLDLLVHLVDVILVSIISNGLRIAHRTLAILALIQLEEWNPLQHLAKLLLLFHWQVFRSINLFFQTSSLVHIFRILGDHVNYIFILFHFLAGITDCLGDVSIFLFFGILPFLGVQIEDFILNFVL